ncbi:MAG: VWA domain-containing protein [Rhodocyclaceae bacterium]|nr:VWA domain-containing protein [Rhodocyclaceae bacterium]
MSPVPSESHQEALLKRWQAAWPEALNVWSKYTRLRDARLCTRRVEAAKEGLDGSFAMIRLNDQSVVIDLETVAELGLDDYALEILAHEIGHHVLAPGSVNEQFRLLARIRKGLPTLERHAPMVANLYSDLIINDRLQRQSELRLGDIYRRLSEAQSEEEKKSSGQVWNLYLRIYENLWKLAPGSLGAHKGDESLEGDAWLGARLIRVYASNWLVGAGRFAALLLRYLVEDEKHKKKNLIGRLLDTTGAAAGCEPQGGLDIDADELDGAKHPSEDAAVTGLEEEDAAEDGARAHDKASAPGGGQKREPYEYGEILRAAGITLSDHEIAIRYYRERALPYLVPFPTRVVADSPEPQLEGLEPWDIGDPLDEVDWLQSVMQSPRSIPGLTTVRRLYGHEPGVVKERRPVNLDLYVDSSGSMPNPQHQTSFLSLAGAIIALSALRSGSAVQVTLWSGKNEFMHTSGFIRNDTEILRVLTGFYGGATCFPIHRLRETYEKRTKEQRPTHILMISDDGITTMFANDERGRSGWEVSAQALKQAGAGGTMALNIPTGWEEQTKGYAAPAYAQLKQARSEQGWDIHAISRLEDLVDFARAFARRHYA